MTETSSSQVNNNYTEHAHYATVCQRPYGHVEKYFLIKVIYMKLMIPPPPPVHLVISLFILWP